MTAISLLETVLELLRTCEFTAIFLIGSYSKKFILYELS